VVVHGGAGVHSKNSDAEVKKALRLLVGLRFTQFCL
jgi:isoaspartyl peptidase/L-asparaginase-like protein (Ntn-hydrolase superfamily)